MSTNTELFPAIGSVVEQTQKLPVEQQTVEVTLDEERPVQEIESLCMRCEEQVCSMFVRQNNAALTRVYLGCHQTAPDHYPVLPGGHRHVLPMRALWLLK